MYMRIWGLFVLSNREYGMEIKRGGTDLTTGDKPMAR